MDGAFNRGKRNWRARDAVSRMKLHGTELKDTQDVSHFFPAE